MDVRTQILDAATRLFAARGYEGTSLSAIAVEVGVKKPSLLYHFPSKDALHRSVLDQVLSHWNDVLPRLLEAAAGEDRFDAILSETIRFFRADPDRARLLLREALDRPTEMRERLTSHVRPWIRVMADFIERGKNSGEIRADTDAEAYVLQVINLVIGGVAMADTLGVALSDDHDDDEPNRMVREIERVARTSLFSEARPTGA